MRGMSQLGEGEIYEEVSFILAVLQKYGETTNFSDARSE